MSVTSNELSFEIVDTHNCKLLAIMDTSTYLGVPEGLIIQVKPPSFPVKELNYNKSAITIFNSNSLGFTNVTSSINYTDLPDGEWIIKISICPYNVFWSEKKFYRTCQIWCKYYTAFLKSKMSGCDTCPENQIEEKLETAKRYIEGVEAQAINCDFGTASKLYTIANNILNSIIDCDCG